MSPLGGWYALVGAVQARRSSVRAGRTEREGPTGNRPRPGWPGWCWHDAGQMLSGSSGSVLLLAHPGRRSLKPFRLCREGVAFKVRRMARRCCVKSLLHEEVVNHQHECPPSPASSLGKLDAASKRFFLQAVNPTDDGSEPRDRAASSVASQSSFRQCHDLLSTAFAPCAMLRVAGEKELLLLRRPLEAGGPGRRGRGRTPLAETHPSRNEHNRNSSSTSSGRDERRWSPVRQGVSLHSVVCSVPPSAPGLERCQGRRPRLAEV